MKRIDGGVTAAKGFKASSVRCGIKKSQKKPDLALIMSEVPASAACVYTKNRIFGAPITVTREHLKNGVAQAVLCNSGNANTCNPDGVDIANAMCALLADAASIKEEDIIIGSTGVIGQPLPIEPIKSGMKPLVAALSADGSDDAAYAMMTTDTRRKSSSYSFEVGGKLCAIGGIAKGSGMIHPNMATMLAFVTTDCAISSEMLQKALSSVVKDSFNMISVDRDTSTNDTLGVLANGMAGNAEIASEGEAFAGFKSALAAVCTDLARMIAKDGEGATKLITCRVSGAPSDDAARSIAKSVVCSNLTKAAMFGEDANWGRILCAIGYADGDFAIDDTKVVIASEAGEILVCESARGVPFSEEKAKAILEEDEIEILIDMNAGDFSATAWGCDLTYDYVKINGDYRT